MKRLLFASLALLAGCQSAPDLSPTQAAVAEWQQQNQDDPASYQPVRWGKESAWLQADADRQQALVVGQKASAAVAEMNSSAENVLKVARAGATKQEVAPFEEIYDKDARIAKALRKREDSLAASTNDTRLGTVLMHAYRHKNKAGATVLDSARFLLQNGRVFVL